MRAGEAIRTGQPAPPRGAGDLLTRLASAIVLAAISVLGAWFGGIPAGLVVAAVVALVHLEWIGITEGSGSGAWVLTALLVTAVIVASGGYLAFGCAIAAIGIVAGAVSRRDIWRPAGVLYAAVLGLSLLALRDSDSGLAAIAFLLAIVWATDTGAYFAGRSIGGPKLWPAVSPKKTWAGAIGGLVVGVAAGIAVAAIADIPIAPALVVVAVVLSVASQIGDLFESFVKRSFGAKDSGNIIPGHGGLMDRVDGLVSAALVAVAIGYFNDGAADLARGLTRW